MLTFSWSTIFRISLRCLWEPGLRNHFEAIAADFSPNPPTVKKLSVGFQSTSSVPVVWPFNELTWEINCCKWQPRTLRLHCTYASDLLHAPEKLSSHCIFDRGRAVCLGLRYKNMPLRKKGPGEDQCPPYTLFDGQDLHWCLGRMLWLNIIVTTVPYN